MAAVQAAGLNQCHQAGLREGGLHMDPAAADMVDGQVRS